MSKFVLRGGQRATVLFLGVSCLLQLAAMDSFPAELPVEKFFKAFEHDDARLSPDGKYVAVRAPVEGRYGLAVIDLANRTAKWAHGDQRLDVTSVAWATSDRLLFTVGNNGYRWSGLFAVGRDGSRLRTVIGFGDPRSQLLCLVPDSPDEVLVTSYPENSDCPDVLRVNIQTGRKRTEVKNPGKVLAWLADRSGRVRIGLRRLDTRYQVIHRADEKTAWETLYEFDWKERGMFPYCFEKEGRTLMVGWTGEEDTEGLYTYDTTAKKIGQLAFRHQQADFDAVVFSTTKKTIVGVLFETDRPQAMWFDPDYRRLQAGVDRVLTNTLNKLVDTSDDQTRALFLASSDRDPGAYYLVDTTAPRLEKLFDRAGWILSREMASMKPIAYTSRDGLPINGYLTLPNGSPGTNLSMVVMPHGGPTARDSWGYDPSVQFLANRGHAVLQMNFRGSTGYGRKFMEAGFRQWGLKQQDDITDGVKWAIAQGIADPKRIAIFGASYGGFATLTGLEQTPELYRCGICYAGVTDIVRTFQTDISFGTLADLRLNRLMLADMIGDMRKDKERLKAISPLHNAHLIQAPVFLAYGELDPRVPISTGHDMANALRTRGKLAEFMVKADEGHGFFQEKNMIEFWTKVDAFLKKHLN